MYRVTHVAAIDGQSRMIVSWTTIPVKNNIIIYSEVYRCEIPYAGFFSYKHSVF